MYTFYKIYKKRGRENKIHQIILHKYDIFILGRKNNAQHFFVFVILLPAAYYNI